MTILTLFTGLCLATWCRRMGSGRRLAPGLKGCTVWLQGQPPLPSPPHLHPHPTSWSCPHLVRSWAPRPLWWRPLVLSSSFTDVCCLPSVGQAFCHQGLTGRGEYMARCREQKGQLATTDGLGATMQGHPLTVSTPTSCPWLWPGCFLFLECLSASPCSANPSLSQDGLSYHFLWEDFPDTHLHFSGLGTPFCSLLLCPSLPVRISVTAVPSSPLGSCPGRDSSARHPT